MAPGRTERSLESSEDIRDAVGQRGDVSVSTRPGLAQSYSEASLGGLCSILTIPLDVLFEILASLAPEDLISVFKTNKHFYQYLSPPEAAFLWKVVCRAEGAPNPPPDMSQPRWTMLLFENKCQRCDKVGCREIDFGLLRRLCATCIKQHTIAYHELRETFPGILQAITDLIPSSQKRSKVYWRTDIYKVMEPWKLLKNAFDLSLPGSEADLEAFEMERCRLVRRIARNAPVYLAWHRGFLERRTIAKEEIRHRRQQEMLQRFLNMGYQTQDIHQAIFSHPEYREPVELSDEIWARIHPSLEEQIKDKARARILELLKPAFTEYLKTLPPNQWMRHPRLQAVISRPKLLPYVQQCKLSDGEVLQLFQDKAIPRLPHVARKLTRERKRIHRQTVLEYISTSGLPVPTAGKVLNLALWIFNCTKCVGSLEAYSGRSIIRSPLDDDVMFFGWQSAKNHCEHPLKIMDTSVRTLWTIITMAGLDPPTATVQQMDDSDLLLSCNLCSPDLATIAHTVSIFTWRSAAYHACHHYHYHYPELESPSPGWKLLTPEQRALVREEHTLTHDWEKCWSCNHCHEHFFALANLTNVTAHIAAKHAIFDPQEGTDMVLYPSEQHYSAGYAYDPPPPPRLTTPTPITETSIDEESEMVKPQRAPAAEIPATREPKTYTCIHCDQDSRPFGRRSVRQHIKAKHKVKKAQEGRDYVNTLTA